MISKILLELTTSFEPHERLMNTLLELNCHALYIGKVPIGRKKKQLYHEGLVFKFLPQDVKSSTTIRSRD